MMQQELSLRQTPVLDRVNESFIDKLSAKAQPPVYTLTPNEARRSLLDLQSHVASKPETQVKDFNVNSGRFELRLRIIRSLHATDRGPVIMHFHGGGWVLGDAKTHDRLVRCTDVECMTAMLKLEEAIARWSGSGANDRSTRLLAYSGSQRSSGQFVC